MAHETLEWLEEFTGDPFLAADIWSDFCNEVDSVLGRRG